MQNNVLSSFILIHQLKLISNNKASGYFEDWKLIYFNNSHNWAIPRFRTYTSDSSVLYLVIQLSIYIIVKVMFQYSVVLFTSITIKNFVIFVVWKKN